MSLPELPKGLTFKAGDGEGRQRGYYGGSWRTVPGISLRKKPFGRVLYRSAEVNFASDRDVEYAAEELLKLYEKDEAKFAKVADAKAVVNKHGKDTSRRIP